ncbi:MAG: glycosyltransferase family 2 protein [Acidobacteria bacterium]|nr:glycosyltransferase family 2 protein [Acidobacteriota bacterium]
MTTDQPGIAAIILTKNEEQDLPGCLESLRLVADEVYVIDSGSTDRTLEIAAAAGATVLFHKFENHARQMNWALGNVPSNAAWMIRLDADERISPELARSIRTAVDRCDAQVNGLLMPRRTVFLGKRLRFGGTYPVWLLRAWRSGTASCEDRWMDEHMVLSSGQTAKVEGELLHIIPKDLAEWSRKHVWYAERECIDARSNGTASENFGGQAKWKRTAKNGVFYRLPPVWRAFGYWVFRYIFMLGILDGGRGFVYHFLQAAWYRVLVDCMLCQDDWRRPSAATQSPQKAAE